MCQALSLQLDDVELSMGMSGDFEQAVRPSAVDSCVCDAEDPGPCQLHTVMAAV